MIYIAMDAQTYSDWLEFKTWRIFKEVGGWQYESNETRT